MCDTPSPAPATGISPACRTMVVMPRKPLSMPTVGTALLASLALAAGVVAGPGAPSVQAAVPGSAGAAVSTANDDPTAVDALLHKRLRNPRLGDDVGMVVIDAATGAVVSQQDADQAMLPASNMKIVTAVAALARMGGGTVLRTAVRQGATASDLVLEGGGDPLLTTTDLRQLAKRTAAVLPAGAPVVVHVDDDLFPRTGKGPGWTRTYLGSEAARVEALARLGDYSRDPSTAAAAVFVDRLTKLGVPATLGTDADGGQGTVLATTDGHTVKDAVAVMLSHSENNVAEVLHRQVAVAAGVPATWAGARTAVEQVLRDAGIDPSAQRLSDGSGLSRTNRVTPRFLADVLRYARVTKPGAFASMFEPGALPVAGRTGTLITGFGRYVTKQSACARGEVQAKTGSLFDTTALSGVAHTVSGGERIFSVLVNDRPQRYSALSTRQAIDGLTATMTGCWD